MSCSAGSSAQRHRRWQPLLVSASSGPVPPDAPRALAEEARTVLGLPHAASTRDVASAFRRMALLKHPDRPGGLQPQMASAAAHACPAESSAPFAGGSSEEFAHLHSAYVHAMVNSSSSDGVQAACEARSVHPEQQQVSRTCAETCRRVAGMMHLNAATHLWRLCMHVGMQCKLRGRGLEHTRLHASASRMGAVSSWATVLELW